MKKVYAKPALNSRVIALGVFGTYNNDPTGGGGGGGGGNQPQPIRNINDHRLSME